MVDRANFGGLVQTPHAPPLLPLLPAGADCLAEEDGSVIVRDDLDALLQVGSWPVVGSSRQLPLAPLGALPPILPPP